MLRNRVTTARVLVGAHGTNGEAREQEPIPFLSPRRIRMNINAVLEDKDAWLTPAYSLAIQAEHLLQVTEGKREVVADPKPTRRSAAPRQGARISWTEDMRRALLADPRKAREIATEYGTSTANIHVQRSIARKLVAA